MKDGRARRPADDGLQVNVSPLSGQRDTTDGPYVTSSTVTRDGDVHALAASATAVFAGATALLRFPNSGDLSVRRTRSMPWQSGAVKSLVLFGGKIFTGHQDGKIRVWKQAILP